MIMAVQLCLGSTVSRSVAFYGVIDERIAAKLHTPRATSAFLMRLWTQPSSSEEAMHVWHIERACELGVLKLLQESFLRGPPAAYFETGLI